MFTCFRCEIKFEEEDGIIIDHGGYEEFWGAKVWHSQMTLCCPKCKKDDIEEAENEECD